MPKLVDHDERRVQLAEAAWRIIRRLGIEGASVRNIAEEAGMSLGSLRHYFSTQSELLAFSMNLVSERVHRRIQQIEWTGDPRKDTEKVIFELLPLDDERLTEMQVWLSFTSKALADPTLQDLNRNVFESFRTGLRRCVIGLMDAGMAASDLDVDNEVMRLHALVDGLALHGAHYPEQLPPEKAIRIVRHHLDGLRNG